MRVVVDAALRIARGALPAKLAAQLVQELSFPNPAYRARVRRGLHPGREPEQIYLVEEDHRELRLPRGAIYALRRLAASAGVSIECDDRRVLPAEPLPELPVPLLRAYQQEAVDRLAKATQGVVIMPCGGGKTRVGIGAVARLRTPTLVLVHTLDLAAQWRDGLRDLLGIEAGVIGGGEVSPAPVTIAVVQALAQWSPADLTSFLGRFGLLIAEECHHTPATMFRDVVHRCPARYRLGLTATPDREDGLTPLLELYLGQPLARVSHDELVAAGVLVLPEVRFIETELEYPYRGAEDYGPMLAALVADVARNASVVESVAAEAREGHTCLVLSGRIDHCVLLVDQLRAAGVAAAALTGEVSKNERAGLLAEARAGRLPVLVATSLADEGLDLPILSRVFLVYPGRARGRTLQRIGRLMRPHPNKSTAILVDFVDRRIPVLRRHHLERRRLYAELLGVPASQLGAAGAQPRAAAAMR